MNFFQNIYDLQSAGDWNIVITQTAENKLAVSVTVKNPKTSEATRNIAPLTLEGTPQEFDEQFFTMITAPIQRTSSLLRNLETYTKQVEKTDQKNSSDKKGTQKESKPINEKTRKYEDGLKKADELEAQGKFREAWVKVPEPTDYPEHSEFLMARRKELSAKFLDPTFFD